MQQILIVASVLCIAGVLPAQVPAANDACAKHFDELRRQVIQLQIEVTELKFQAHQANIQRLQADLNRVVVERNYAQQEEQMNHEETLGVERQLARTDLPEDERAELNRLRDSFTTNASAAARERQNAARAAEAALEKQLAAELHAAEKLKIGLQDLTQKQLSSTF